MAQAFWETGLGPYAVGSFYFVTRYVDYSLKCHCKDDAIELLRGMIVQRQNAYMRNVEVFGVDRLRKQAERIQKKEKCDKKLISFLLSATDQEIDLYLAENEVRAIQF